MSATGRQQTVTLTWKLSPIQRQYFESDAKYRTLVGGRRFGKNTVGLASEIDYALNPDAYPWGRDDPADVVTWWVAPTYTQAKKYGFEKAREMLPGRLIDGDPRYSYPFEIPLINGATMEFFSYASPESLDGAGVDSMVIDERGYMDDDVWTTNLAPMLLDTDGRASFIGKAAYSEHFVECFERGQGPADTEFASWQATSYDNPFIPDERIDDLFANLPERVFNREILADFDAGGEFLTRDMLTFVEGADVPDRDLSWIVYVDLGLEADPSKARENDTDYWAAAIVAYDGFRQQAYLVDVTRTRGMTKDQGVAWLLAIMDGVPTNRAFVESNQAQRWFVEDAQKAGLNVQGIENTRPKDERITYLSVPFANERVNIVNHDDPDERTRDQEFDPRWGEFVAEWLAFPTGSHDDQLDAVEGALRQVNLGTGVQAYGGRAYGDA